MPKPTATGSLVCRRSRVSAAATLAAAADLVPGVFAYVKALADGVRCVRKV